MKRSFLHHALALLGCSICAAGAVALPAERPQLASEPAGPGLVSDFEETFSPPSKALQDTIWIADWSFDAPGGGCTFAGWEKYDLRILNDGSNYWSVRAGFGCFATNAAVLAKHDLAWARDGYGNNWDYSIILKYQGASTLSFDFQSDSEPGFDFVTVEADSAGASEWLVDYSVFPNKTASEYRTVLLTFDGVHSCATAGPIALPDFGVPATVHEVYIRFASDGGYSDEDGYYPTQWNAALAVDNISISGTLTYSEDFEGALDPNVTFANTAPATPFGLWAQLYQRITDNDKCTENTTCAWVFSDPLRTAFFPDMAFGPGSAVIRNWLDLAIVSPWVSLASTPNATGTVISFRRFAGNDYNKGRIVQNWSVRSRVKLDNTDTSAPGDSIVVAGPWAHASNWGTLTQFYWNTLIGDMTHYLDRSALEVQVRFRVADWQWIAGASSPATLDPGPGPYLDRVRIGRRVLAGPVFNPGIDVRSQAQDCFPTYRNSIRPGEHYSPSTDKFGSAAFTLSTDLAINASSRNLVTGDSIWMEVKDVRSAGGVSSVRWYGAITRGPHAGKAPAPWTAGANGFFEVTPDSARSSAGSVIAERWFVDLDDTYFRGGDVLLYFWTATDAGGGRGSFPQGITGANFPPASPAAAELATGGLCEVSFLPTIDWSPSYLVRIAADPHGDLDPTPAEIAESEQATCVLYYAAGFGGGNGRRSSDLNRTSFMYTLDRLGYRGYYDVYDHQGYGNTNNQLGGRATIPQCAGYALIVHDTGRGTSPNIPNGWDLDSEKINQCQWYRDFLAQGLTSPVGVASLWLIGEDNASEKQTNPLISTDFALASVVNNQGLAVSPDLVGQGSFTFSTGNVASFAGDVSTLTGGCPIIRDYDGATNAGSAVVTHRYAMGATTGPGAIIMNKNATLHWNTIWMGFGWFDLVVPVGGDPASGTGAPDTRLARKILNAVLPVGCVQGESPTGVPEPEVDAVPAVTTLHPNVPNPFNPTTTIRFDLARDGLVRLRIFDPAGRLVKTLLDGEMTRGFGRAVTWNGLDESGRRVPSGVYFYALVTEDATATRKMVMLK